jgi:transketolase N-terminal domain/subunit
METTNALAPNLTAAESIRGTLAKSTLDMLQAGESRIQDAAKAAAASAVESVMGAMGQLLDETEARLAGLKPAVLTIQMPDMREDHVR